MQRNTPRHTRCVPLFDRGKEGKELISLGEGRDKGEQGDEKR